ncbi:hypothetical protein [Streptomyces cyaneofuscatus]|uniref:hypothetical protein n=1 Tax=Streptomyces cyaneofuscatus TaxID=66883 RepID=UPI00380FC5D7
MQDRNRGHHPTPHPPRDAEADAILRQILAMPSLAAQLLTAAAENLAADNPTGELTVLGWGLALAAADAHVLSRYTSPIAQSAGRRAMRALSADMWDTARTRGEWAICLHAAARSV